ncbi:hypothetical protein [Niallia oryzisoli]
MGLSTKVEIATQQEKADKVREEIIMELQEEGKKDKEIQTILSIF